MRKLAIPFGLLLVAFACQKLDNQQGLRNAPQLPETPYDYSPDDLPQHIRFVNEGGLGQDEVRISDEKATLGRVLFYDPKLSLNNATSCGSCHKQAFGFGDPQRFSTGFETHSTTRNSPPISNAGCVSQFFWDLRSDNLKDQVMEPVQNHIEMGIEDIQKLPGKLEQLEYYGPLFEAAYGTSEISAETIAESLAEYLKSMLSYNSKWDQGSDNDFANFNAQERFGKELFFEQLNCGYCHGGPHVGGWGSANIGLDMSYDDHGVGALSGDELHEGQFKIPSLRNVALTEPYMHDGRFASLEEVIDHYDHGVQPHPNLDYRLQVETDQVPINFLLQDPFAIGQVDFISLPIFNLEPTGTPKPRRLNLTPAEKNALVAFLGTLTDRDYVRDEKFSDPF